VVSVPLRGSGMKGRAVDLRVEGMSGRVSVPLRGSGMKVANWIVTTHVSIPSFRPLAGKWDESSLNKMQRLMFITSMVSVPLRGSGMKAASATAAGGTTTRRTESFRPLAGKWDERSGNGKSTFGRCLVSVPLRGSGMKAKNGVYTNTNRQVSVPLRGSGMKVEKYKCR
jgi:hypothetical protein